MLTNTPVEDVAFDHVVFNKMQVPANCIVWGAGVKASPAGRWLGVEGVAGGRIPVTPDLQVVGHPFIHAIGDTAAALGADGKPLPALAQVAKQQGTYVGKALAQSLRRGAEPQPFRFRNRGNTAVIGRNAAVFDFGRWHLKGRIAWLLWALVHVYLLVNFEKRILVSIQWIWRYVTSQRGARLIDEDAVLAIARQQPDGDRNKAAAGK